jgi:hypothetical protein
LNHWVIERNRRSAVNPVRNEDCENGKQQARPKMKLDADSVRSTSSKPFHQVIGHRRKHKNYGCEFKKSVSSQIQSSTEEIYVGVRLKRTCIVSRGEKQSHNNQKKGGASKKLDRRAQPRHSKFSHREFYPFLAVETGQSIIGAKVRREKAWCNSRPELVRSTAAPVAIGWGDPFSSRFGGAPQSDVGVN